MTYSDVDTLPHTSKINITGAPNKDEQIEKYIIISFLFLFVLAVGYLEFFLRNSKSPFLEKNDYRICTVKNFSRTAKLTRFNLNEEIPNGCSLRLDPDESLVQCKEPLENWAWAVYNAREQYTKGDIDDSQYITYFRQYWDFTNAADERKKLLTCKNHEDLDLIACLLNFNTTASLTDWSWTKK